MVGGIDYDGGWGGVVYEGVVEWGGIVYDGGGEKKGVFCVGGVGGC